jgi:hypothetical protein
MCTDIARPDDTYQTIFQLLPYLKEIIYSKEQPENTYNTSMSPYNYFVLGSQDNTGMYNTDAHIMATDVAVSGKTRTQKRHWCWSATSGCLPWLRKPAKEVMMRPPREMARLYLDHDQPRREPPMKAPQPLPRAVLRPVRPVVQRTDHLGHYPGGLADDYYLPNDRQPLLESRPAQPRVKRPDCRLGNIPATEAATREFIQQMGSSQPPSIRKQPGPGFGLSTDNGLVFVEFGEQLDRYTTTVLGKASEFPFPRADDVLLHAHNVVVNSLPPLADDFADDWAEQTAQDVTNVDHSMEVSKNRSITFSDEEDASIQMARPAIRRRAMSDCFSVGSDDDDDDSDECASTYAGSIAEITQIKRSDSLTSYVSMVPALVTTNQELAADLYMGRREGPDRFPVIVEATTCKSMTAELCWAFDDDGETTSSDDEKTIYSDSDDDNWDPVVQRSIPMLSTRTRPNLTIQVPNAYSDSMFEAYRPELTAEPARNASPDIMGHHTQVQAYPIDLNHIPMFEDPGWLEPQQQYTALLLAGEDQACLARFAHLWDDPCVEAIDQSLFADFDDDFSGEVEIDISCNF